jgi:hypothetical protein
MLNKETIAVRVALIAGSILLLGIGACSSSSQLINETLDPITSATITSNNKPLVFYRDNPSQAAYARNFLQLGPIAVNRAGRYRYYLWISAWSTMQGNSDSEQRDRLQSIVLFADTEPLNLVLAGWTPDAINTSEGVYVKAVATAVDAYYEVTIDQIRLIAHASNIRISTGPSHSDNYETWDEQKSALDSMRAFHDFVVY